MWVKAAVASLAILAIAVAADHEGLFGYREHRIGDYLHLVFEFVDAQTRAPVSDVHVACTRPMVRSACSETRGPGIGQTTITLAAIRRVNRSFLFGEDVGYLLGSGGVIYLTFIGANHERASLQIRDDDPILIAGQPHRIELTKTAR